MKAFKWQTLKKLKNHKWKIGIFALLFVSVFVFLSNPAYAGPIVWLVGGIAQAIVSVLGLILTQVIGVLVKVAQYNNFIKEGPVTNGWVIVRDIANMFFVVILLIIAFATILRIERYNYKKWLPKLLIMAVLINFSKTICGLLIDAAQVIMLTFVTAFAPMMGGNIVDLLGISGWNEMRGDIEVKSWTVAGLYVLSVIYVVISLIVVVAMLAMLVMRMVMIWIYVVLSPLAFLLSSFPDGAKYASQWWSEFTKNLIVGPVLAFFIWLSFTSLVSFDKNNPDLITNIDSQGVDIHAYAGETKVPETTQSLMIKFIIGIGMLIGGMTVAQSIGGAAAGVAGKTFDKGKKVALAAGGVAAGVAGYNFAKRRFSDWKDTSKKKIQQKSDLTYETLKSRAKGVGTGFVRGISTATQKGPKQIELKEEKQNKLKRKQEKRARMNAYYSGEYIDSRGKAYKYDSGKEQYIADDGSVAKDIKGENIKKMKDFEAGFASGMTDKMTKAKALRNQISEEKLSKEQKIFESAGSSVVDLKRVMNNSSESSNKRIAAAIQLAIKEGFKNKDLAAGRHEVMTAKNLMVDNEPMLRKFEEQINKRFAALNFDVDVNAENFGEEFKAALASGKINGYNQDASTYDEQMIRTLKDYSGRDFAKNIKNTMSNSGEHRNRVTTALLNARNTDMRKGKPMFDTKTDEINDFAKILARDGEIVKAFNNTTNLNEVKFDNKSMEALSKYFETAKAEHVGNINGDVLDPNKLAEILKKSNINISDNERKNIVNNINISLAKGLDISKLANLERSDANPELVRRALGAIEKYGSGEKKNEIKENNMLKNIKPISAA